MCQEGSDIQTRIMLTGETFDNCYSEIVMVMYALEYLAIIALL